MEELAAGEMLPSRIHLCGGGSRLPEIREALAAERFWKRLPFARPPEVAIMAPDQVEADLGRDRAPRRPAGRDAAGPRLAGDRDPDLRGSARRRAAPRPAGDEGLGGRRWPRSSTWTPTTRSRRPPTASARPTTRGWRWSSRSGPASRRRGSTSSCSPARRWSNGAPPGHRRARRLGPGARGVRRAPGLRVGGRIRGRARRAGPTPDDRRRDRPRPSAAAVGLATRARRLVDRRHATGASPPSAGIPVAPAAADPAPRRGPRGRARCDRAPRPRDPRREAAPSRRPGRAHRGVPGAPPRGRRRGRRRLPRPALGRDQRHAADRGRRSHRRHGPRRPRRDRGRRGRGRHPCPDRGHPGRGQRRVHRDRQAHRVDGRDRWRALEATATRRRPTRSRGARSSGRRAASRSRSTRPCSCRWRSSPGPAPTSASSARPARSPSRPSRRARPATWTHGTIRVVPARYNRTLITVTNPAATTGGTKKEFTRVSKKDVDAALRDPRGGSPGAVPGVPREPGGRPGGRHRVPGDGRARRVGPVRRPRVARQPGGGDLHAGP